MSAHVTDTRRKILDAAVEIAREAGPGNLALDAVAAKAGVSKGGLLYHFPSKAKLLEGVVESHLGAFERALREREQRKRGHPNGLMEAYLELFVEDHDAGKPPPSGLLAALSENPGFLAPVRDHHRALLDRLRETADPAMSLVIFLAIQGLRSMSLLNLDVLTDEEAREVAAKLQSLVGTPEPASGA